MNNKNLSLSDGIYEMCNDVKIYPNLSLIDRNILIKELQDYKSYTKKLKEPTETECCEKLDKIPIQYIERYLRKRKLDKLEYEK